MNNFWKWISKKGYGNKSTIDGSVELPLFIDYEKIEEKDIPKQMLIGYMIEYLIEKKEKDTIKFTFGNIADISNIYDILKHKIEIGENTNLKQEEIEANNG